MANPFIALEADNSSTETTISDLPPLEEFAWDFANNRYIYDGNGRIKTVYENEALKVWIYKMLKVERYRFNVYVHGIYNDEANYGVMLEKYIGKYPNNEKTAGLIRREIYDAILANPYVTKINSLEIAELKNEHLTLSMDLTSIYGNLNLSSVII